jgi:hypothetical protein
MVWRGLPAINFPGFASCQVFADLAIPLPAFCMFIAARMQFQM